MKNRILKNNEMSCPICHMIIRRSNHLHYVYSEDFYAEWFCNLVTHDRYDHIKSWRELLKKPQNQIRSPENRTKHQYIKELYNNRSKRRLIRGISKARIDLGHKTGLINACMRVTVNLLRENINNWDTNLKQDTLKTIDVAENYYKKLRKIKIGNDNFLPRKKKEYEMVYVGNDPAILDKLKRNAEAEFKNFEDDFKQASLDVNH